MRCCGSKWGGKREQAGRKKTCIKKVPFNRRINENILNILKDFAKRHNLTDTEALESAILLQSNIEKLKEAFVEGLEISIEEVESATMESVDKWDSIGQMSLVAIIEDAFGVEFEPEEVMRFTSFAAGVDILKNHGIEI